MRQARVPIVPAAILFDLLSGGDKKLNRPANSAAAMVTSADMTLHATAGIAMQAAWPAMARL